MFNKSISKIKGVSWGQFMKILFWIFLFSSPHPGTAFSSSLALNPQMAEIQWAICDPPLTFISKMNFKIQSNRKKSVSFFDRPDYYYLHRGLILRSKLDLEKNKYSSALKISLKPNQALPSALQNIEDLKCEWDHYSSEIKVGCKINNKSNSVKNQWSPLQKKILSDLGHPLDQIQTTEIGPFNYEEWLFEFSDSTYGTLDFIKTSQEGFSEFSIRVPNKQAPEKILYWNQNLKNQKVRLCEKQQGRTIQIFNSFFNESIVFNKLSPQRQGSLVEIALKQSPSKTY